MSELSEIKEILIEMCELQRGHLEQTREVMRESPELQRQAIARQEQVVNFSRIVVFVILAIIVCLIILLVNIRTDAGELTAHSMTNSTLVAVCQQQKPSF